MQFLKEFAYRRRVAAGSGRGVVDIVGGGGEAVGVAVELAVVDVVEHWGVAYHIRFVAAESFVALLRR